MQLNTVVLPAPFGPISAVISPRRAANEKSLTATRPPKRMLRCSTRSTARDSRLERCRLGAHRPPPRRSLRRSSMALPRERGLRPLALGPAREERVARLEECRRFARRDQPARPPYHDQHHRKAEQQHAVLGRIEIIAEYRLEEVELAHDFGAADHDDGGDR